MYVDALLVMGQFSVFSARERAMAVDDRIECVLNWLARELVDRLPPRKPRPVAVSPIAEDHNMLVYKVSLPPVLDPDVVKRVLSVVVNDGTPAEQEAVDGMELRFADNDRVVLSLVHIDDAGNTSAPSEPLAFVALDTIAPHQPGQVSLTLIAEE